MEDPYNNVCRIYNWKELLSQLVLLGEIYIYNISSNGYKISIETTTGFIIKFYYDDEIISNTIRQIRLDQLLGHD